MTWRGMEITAQQAVKVSRYRKKYGEHALHLAIDSASFQDFDSDYSKCEFILRQTAKNKDLFKVLGRPEWIIPVETPFESGESPSMRFRLNEAAEILQELICISETGPSLSAPVA